MQTLERTVEEAEEALRFLMPEDTRRLERSLSRLSPELTAFVQETLERARIEGRSPVSQINLLTYSLEKWWAHGLATKLAIIRCVTRLSDSRSWPDDSPRGRVINRIIAGAGTATAGLPHVG